MKSSLGIARKLFWLAAPFVASSAIVAAPSQADTSAFADSRAVLGNFSQPADDTGTSAVTDTNTISTDGSVTATANAESIFFPDLGANFATAAGRGDGNEYSGLATGLAEGNGLFSIGSGKTFSFDFFSSLTLIAAVDNPSTESAQASGGVLFNLFDQNNSLLDSFGLSGQATPTNKNSIEFVSSPYVTLASFTQDKSSLGNALFANATVAGTYARMFDSATQLRLEESKISQASVSAKAVPEPSELAGAAVMALFLMGLRLKTNRGRRTRESGNV